MPVAADYLLAALADALLDEEKARSSVRAALRRQADLLQQLQRLGLPATRVAHRLGAARGEALSPGDRQRVARRLRKRAERETTRRAEHSGAHGLTASAISPSDRAITPDQKETPMAKLVKRTVTEEFIEEQPEEHDEDLEEEEAEDGGEEADEPEAKPARRRK